MLMMLVRSFASLLLFALAALPWASARADEPAPWQIWLPPAATPLMERVADFNNLVMVIILGISLFVLALMLFVMVRFRASRQRTPSSVSHNVALEVAWTLVPTLILVLIAVPSFRLLAYQERLPDFDLTIKATGNQWYWSYEYPDSGISFDALMLTDSELQPGQPRLLATDMPLTVPVNQTVRMLVTGADVLHSWTVPAFGIKVDAVPGRVNQTWFRATRPGVYYGQCSELCGTRHSFMPIEVHVVSAAAWRRWLSALQAEQGVAPQEASAAGAAAPISAAPISATPASAAP